MRDGSLSEPATSASDSESARPARTQIWSSSIAAVTHGAIGLLVLKYFVFVGTICGQEFRKYDFELPQITGYFMQAADFCCAHLGLLTVLVMLFVLFDFVVLQWLGRPGSFRILRELWAATLTFIPLAAVVFGSVSIILTLMQMLDRVAAK